MPAADFLPAGEAAFLAEADFLPFSAAPSFLPGVNLVNFSTILAGAAAATGLAAAFLAPALEAALAVRLAAAPPLTLAAAVEAAGAAFLAAPLRATTAVVPSLNYQSSLPETMPCETSPLEKSGTSAAGTFSRAA